MVPGVIRLDGRRRFRKERLGCRHPQHCRFEKDERLNTVRVIESQLQGDCTAAGVPNHVRPTDTEVIKQPCRITRMIGNADSAGGVRAACHAPLVVPNQPVPINEFRLGEQWHVASGDVRTAYEQHGIARTLDLVFQRDVAEVSLFP